MPLPSSQMRILFLIMNNSKNYTCMPKTLVLLYCKCSIIFCRLVKRKKKRQVLSGLLGELILPGTCIMKFLLPRYVDPTQCWSVLLYQCKESAPNQQAHSYCVLNKLCHNSPKKRLNAIYGQLQNKSQNSFNLLLIVPLTGKNGRLNTFYFFFLFRCIILVKGT